MPVTFPEARGFTINDNDFICAWVEHVSRYWPAETNPYLSLLHAACPTTKPDRKWIRL